MRLWGGVTESEDRLGGHAYQSQAHTRTLLTWHHAKSSQTAMRTGVTPISHEEADRVLSYLSKVIFLELGFKVKSAWFQRLCSLNYLQPSPCHPCRWDPTGRLGSARSRGVCVCVCVCVHACTSLGAHGGLGGGGPGWLTGGGLLKGESLLTSDSYPRHAGFLATLAVGFSCIPRASPPLGFYFF